MALFKYLRPVEATSTSSSPLSSLVPQTTVDEINKQVTGSRSTVRKRKRGEYSKYSENDKALIAKYASEHGVSKALKHFREKDLKESSVRDWKKAYEKELRDRCKRASPGEEVAVVALCSKKRGRPPLLGEKLDKYLQEIISYMRSRGVPIGTSITMGIGRGILLKHNRNMLEDFGGSIKLNKEWAKSVLRRMGFSKRRANSKSKLLPGDFVEIKKQFLVDIKTIVRMQDIPDQLVLNWDQTAMKLVPSGSWTMDKKGTKRVEISGIDDKRQITAVFCGSLSGDFLPLQLIYKGTTDKCLPSSITFPPDWHITYTSNHWSNNKTMIEYVSHIIVPYITRMRKTLNLSSDHSALVLFDVFKGQCTENVIQLLEDNNIFYVLIPANCTDQLQPLDLSVNKPAKDFLKLKFQQWYGQVILKQLQDEVSEPVDMRLSIMKPLCAQWTIDMYHYFKQNPSIIINGFRAAGITLKFLL